MSYRKILRQLGLPDNMPVVEVSDENNPFGMSLHVDVTTRHIKRAARLQRVRPADACSCAIACAVDADPRFNDGPVAIFDRVAYVTQRLKGKRVLAKWALSDHSTALKRLFDHDASKAKPATIKLMPMPESWTTERRDAMPSATPGYMPKGRVYRLTKRAASPSVPTMRKIIRGVARVGA